MSLAVNRRRPSLEVRIEMAALGLQGRPSPVVSGLLLPVGMLDVCAAVLTLLSF